MLDMSPLDVTILAHLTASDRDNDSGVSFEYKRVVSLHPTFFTGVITGRVHLKFDPTCGNSSKVRGLSAHAISQTMFYDIDKGRCEVMFDNELNPTPCGNPHCEGCQELVEQQESDDTFISSIEQALSDLSKMSKLMYIGSSNPEDAKWTFTRAIFNEQNKFEYETDFEKAHGKLLAWADHQPWQKT